MINVKTLIEKQLRDTTLEILVFGPTLDPPSHDAHIASMQVKRREIKERLTEEGHSVAFGEDVYDGTLPSHLSDPLLQEVVAMRAADLIIVLVGSPGAIGEAMTIAREKALCAKAGFYCFDDHKDGVVVKHLQFSKAFGATCDLVTLTAVQACSLTSAIIEKVHAVQVGKAFLF